jgi:uncharacterized protein DUF1298
VLTERRKRPYIGEQQVIFASSSGTFRDPDNFGAAWRAARDELGVPDVASHSLCKTVATLIDDAGLFARIGANHLGTPRCPLLIASLGLTAVPGFVSSAPPPFNIVISNVPGVREPMYYNGARLDGNYPLGIALDGQAVNITLANNADNLDFGLVGCRRSVPHLQRLLGHLEDALKDLERAVGV